MDKAVQTWFNNYYGKCLGANGPVREIKNEKDEEAVIAEYNLKFLRPICYIATGNMEVPKDKAVLNKTIGFIGHGPITDWIYLLNYWVNGEFFVYTGDWQGDFDRCVEKTRQEMKVVFATLGRGYRDIALHTINRQTVDDIPYEFLYYPRDLKAHYNGKTLDDLCNKVPSNLSETEIAFLTAAEARGYITESDLTKEEVMWPFNGGKEQRLVSMSVLTPNRPPAAYFELCKTMAPAHISQYPTLFQAVQAYASSSPVPDSVRNFINIISGSDDLMAGVESSGQLTDTDVIAYLRENYGIACTDLSELSVSPKDMLMSAVSVNPEVIEGSARELLEAVTSSNDTAADTLDNIIIQFCKENQLSEKCTIEQLVEVINYDVHPIPPTFLDMVATYMSENNASPETTLDDIIKGVKHKTVDPIDIVIEFVQNNEFYPEPVRKILMDSIVEGEPVAWPDETEILMEALPKLGLPDDMLSRMMIAVQTNSKVQLPKVEPPKELYADSTDPGLKAGALLLEKTREVICQDASAPTRLKYTTVLYSFLRLLMCDPKTELAEVAESIKSRADSAEGVVKALLLKAVDILHGQEV